MMKRSQFTLRCCLLALFVLPGGTQSYVFGQSDEDIEAKAEAVAPEAEAETQVVDEERSVADKVAETIRQMVSIDELRLRVEPLRLEDLEPLAREWEDRVVAVGKTLSILEIALLNPDDDDKQMLQQDAAAKREERRALVDRARIVLLSMEKKGGDVEKMQKYLDTVGEKKIDATDVSEFWLWLQIWLKSPEGGIKIGMNIVKFLATMIAFWIAARIVSAIVRKAVMRMKKASSLMRDFLANITGKAIIIVGFVMAISMLGFPIGPLVAALGAAGLVIGFALQGTLSNFASGILILMYRPYDVGEVITVAGETGKVDMMNLMTTTLITADNQTIVVPNNSVWNSVIKNITGRPIRRVDLVFGIGYDDDIDKAKSVLADILSRHELVLKDPEPTIEVSELADSSVNFICRPWSKTEDYWRLYWDLHAQVKRRFDAEDIGIPYPQRDIHVYQHASAEAAHRGQNSA